MDMWHHRSSWQRALALASLLSLLCLSVVSASHTHGNSTTGSVKNECQLCISGGLSRSLPASLQVFVPVMLTLFPLLLRQERLYSIRSFSSGTPRSPPLS